MNEPDPTGGVRLIAVRSEMMGDKDCTVPEDAIRLRSYQIWQEEGCPHGKALAHWLQAKAELEAQWRGDNSPAGWSSTFVRPRVPISVKPRHRTAAKGRAK